MKNALIEEVGKAVVGREKEVELLTIALLQGGHVLLESVPGTGKTLLAKSFAKACGGDFARVQFTPDVLPSDVTGLHYFNPETRTFELKKGPVMTNFLLADEINRATPRTQSSLLEVMEEKQVTIDGETLTSAFPFMVIATQNPVESQQGTFPLPYAQLDRFMFKLPSDYPDYEDEAGILKQWVSKRELPLLKEVVAIEEIKKASREVRDVTVHNEITDYILTLIRATRSHESIEYGASPRAAVTLLKAAQGSAYLQNRSYVLPEDVKKLFHYVLGHRIQLTPEASLMKNNEQVLDDVIASADAPVELRL
ncbi:AAA family ATPase [Jeotgalibacillus haloalkalitolerans]|uniref:MoxR family ATPase n=1 Tax=Jeotgalibacillus haloalkalitolerans TaxID=3104292 RepID=A0ABU5KQF8_9BACL|nr:MoxR family ATPase [Jeotgalibacillus sp. HH7-29]MDZ5712935.1 MoxR family ATPase [Jeotgalibacillus sp. HH7-29]